MTSYLVTGGTGFLASKLVPRLLSRPERPVVYVLLGEQSRARFAALMERWPNSERVVPVVGDVTQDGLGIDVAELNETPEHVVHLADVYDLPADAQPNDSRHVTGTRNVIAFANRIRARWLHHVSSVAVAGDHAGIFTEVDFDLGQSLPTPHHAMTFEAEKLVRERCQVPFRVYRPSLVVGDSRTGEMDKTDSLGFLIPTFTRLGRLPSWLPAVVPHCGTTNVVPVDYVVAAMEHLMHVDADSGATYHLGATKPQPLTMVYNAFAAPVRGPRVVARIPIDISSTIRRVCRGVARNHSRSVFGQVASAVLAEIGIPASAVEHLSSTVVFDSSATRAALAGTGITCPPLDSYAERLYQYWQGHLDLDRARRCDRNARLRGRRVMITGASSGIGRAVALQVARRGATVLLVARRSEELEALRAEIRADGGSAAVYPCDLTEDEAVDAMVKRVLAEYGAVDMLVNNAGRSIRRSVGLSTNRMHDYERTMALNYFAALRLTFGLLPTMIEQRFGHVVNVTTQGIQVHTPRFSAYLASKAALDAFSKVAGRDLLTDGVTFTSVRIPLVRTPMSAPSIKVFRRIPSLSPEQAGALVVRALEHRPEVVNMPTGTIAELVDKIAPRMMRPLVHLAAYQAMPETAPEARSRPRQHPLAAVAGAVTRLLWRP